MKVQTRTHIYTPEEYLELEETAPYKSQYRDGEIIPMTEGTGNHNKITLLRRSLFPITSNLG